MKFPKKKNDQRELVISMQDGEIRTIQMTRKEVLISKKKILQIKVIVILCIQLLWKFIQEPSVVIGINLKMFWSERVC